jgi:hypothetical protein
MGSSSASKIHIENNTMWKVKYTGTSSFTHGRFECAPDTGRHIDHGGEASYSVINKDGAMIGPECETKWEIIDVTYNIICKFTIYHCHPWKNNRGDEIVTNVSFDQKPHDSLKIRFDISRSKASESGDDSFNIYVRIISDIVNITKNEILKNKNVAFDDYIGNFK